MTPRPGPAGGDSGAPTGAESAPAPGPAPARRRGRPPRDRAAEGGGARERILESARREFSERGYDKTSVRAIAKAAGVDPALVHHYFGTKDEVFEAAIEVTMEPVQLVTSLLEAGPDGIGERLARSFLGAWENPATRTPLLAIIRSALTHEAAGKVLRGFVFQRVLGRVAADLDVPDPQFRAELAASHMIGIAMMRYVIEVEPMASAEVDDIVAMVAPTLQRYLTE